MTYSIYNILARRKSGITFSSLIIVTCYLIYYYFEIIEKKQKISEISAEKYVKRQGRS